MKKNGHILIIDDDQDILAAGKLLLKRHFTAVTVCDSPQQIPQLFADKSFDLVLLDMNFGPGESSGDQGFYWLKEIMQISPQAVVIMITAHGGVHVAVEAMKLGATDYVSKPWQNEKLVATVSAGVQLAQSRTEAVELKQKNQLLAQDASNYNTSTLLGNYAGMQQIQQLIDRAAPTDASVLILGENGTGKELVARELHKRSRRHNNVFMSVDLGALSETLFESELFGHKKGAFTDAREDRIGRFQAANGGTLFLDEIGNLPLHLQAKLLTVLEQRQVVPMGSNKAIAFDVRIIAATNLPPHQLQDETLFRQDLLFRLNTVEVHLPPLRERQQDILLLAEHYIAQYSRKYQKPVKPISTEAQQALLNDAWPGNIRALRHATERAVILSDAEQYSAVDFQLSIGALPSQAPLQPDGYATLNLETLEQQAIKRALTKHRYNISYAAKELGLTRPALYRRMEKYGL